MDKKLSELYDKALSRRNFLVGAGAVGASAALAGCGSQVPLSTYTTTGLGDVDILNFALQLEYLEAEFYLYAATGAGLSAADAGSGGGSTGAGTTIVPSTGTKLTGLTTVQQNIVNEIAYDEQSHVRYLRKALGSAANARPNIDLTFFGPLATAAGITVTVNNGVYTPYYNFDYFVLGAFIFEDVGVTAYNGAAPLISSAGVTAGYLAAAAGILAVEAYHAAYVRTYITAQAINGLVVTPSSSATGTATASTSYAQFGFANKVSSLRSALGGGNETALTLPNTLLLPGTATATALSPTPSYATSIVAASSSNATAYARTPDQVLHIVYGNASVGTASGGFFPNGANYRFATTTT